MGGRVTRQCWLSDLAEDKIWIIKANDRSERSESDHQSITL